MALASAGAALAGLSGCTRRPRGELVPHAVQPPETRPGEPVRYATSMVLDGFATGLLVDTRDGRPVKIDGNPDHPASRGATLAIHQGSLLQLYDPDRARTARHRGVPTTSARVLAALAERAPAEGDLLLLPPQGSPLVLDLLDRVRHRHPDLRIAHHAPLPRTATYRGAQLAFGEPLACRYDYARAGVVVALDADFLALPPHAPAAARAFGRRRQPALAHDPMSRLYVAEGTRTPTGSLADHRLAVAPSRVPALLAHMARALARAGSPLPGAPPALMARAGDALPASARRWAEAAARDLLAADSGLVVVGDGQSPVTHALAHLIHAALNSRPGRQPMAVELHHPAIASPEDDLSHAALASAIERGEVRRLTILEVDPIATAPDGLPLSRLMMRLDDVLHYFRHHTATSALADWFVPAAHYLETWGDGRSPEGTHSLIQPLIDPMYDTPSLVAVLAALAGMPRADPRSLLRDSFGVDPIRAERTLSEYLRTGFVPGSAFPTVEAAPRPDPALWDQLHQLLGVDEPGYELQLLPSNALYDGRFANVPWLQELPDPITKQTWGNAAVISESDAAAEGLSRGDLLRLRTGGNRTITLPALPLRDQPRGVVSVALGHDQAGPGQTVARLAEGGNAYRLWADRTTRSVAPLALERLPGSRALALTQYHAGQHDRDLAPMTTLSEYRRDPDFTADQRGPLPTLLPPDQGFEPRWLMTIDTGTCTGCNACMVACQAENNVPSVGPEGVRAGREMHWLRIDTYRAGPNLVHQPMLCQHCEHAPCEYVCPVGATVHSHDGLNEMVYNRCVGTRFCSNNCPYKVRRFNWLEYHGTRSTRDLALSPDVTVRARGVMEKCTFCVQRIRRASIAARAAGQAHPGPGEVQTACQQACPTGAIQFAQQQHRHAIAVQQRDQPRLYMALHELGTRPRTGYLAKIQNRSPELDPDA